MMSRGEMQRNMSVFKKRKKMFEIENEDSFNSH